MLCPPSLGIIFFPGKFSNPTRWRHAYVFTQSPASLWATSPHWRVPLYSLFPLRSIKRGWSPPSCSVPFPTLINNFTESPIPPVRSLPFVLFLKLAGHNWGVTFSPNFPTHHDTLTSTILFWGWFVVLFCFSRRGWFFFAHKVHFPKTTIDTSTHPFSLQQ